MTCKLSSIFFPSLIAFWVGGASASSSRSVETQLHSIEQVYADFLDSHGAIEAIDSGLQAQVSGHGRRFWSRRNSELIKYLLIEFNKLSNRPLNSTEYRAFLSMRRTFAELTAAGSESSAPNARCSESSNQQASQGELRAALYACFDSLGNQIEFEGERFTRVAALQLLQEIPEPARRKALFLAMLPLWQAINAGNEPSSPYRRLIGSASVEFEQERSPVHAAARSLDIDVPEVERWLVAVLESWRAVSGVDSGLLEPWDYRYRYALASRTLATTIPRDELLPLQERFDRDLGADPTAMRVVFDIEPRPGKAPLAYSDAIRIGRNINGHWRPAIARVSANDDRGGLGILNELVHETGHAVHFMAIRARPAFFWPDTTFIEAFADVSSWSVFTPEWQGKYLGVAASRADGLREQYSGVMLDVAWSLFELRMLRAPATDPNVLWTEITQRYLGIAPHPELSWWAVRSQLVTDPGYMINYGLGALMTAEIRAKTAAAIGPFDVGNPRWYSWTSANLLRFGAEVEVTELMRRFLGHAVTPAALRKDIASIGESGPAAP